MKPTIQEFYNSILDGQMILNYQDIDPNSMDQFLQDILLSEDNKDPWVMMKGNTDKLESYLDSEHESVRRSAALSIMHSLMPSLNLDTFVG